MENGDYIAVSVYGDGSESMTPSWVYNYEMKSVSGNVRYNDDSTMTIETGSDGDFYEMTFDISSAELDIQVDEGSLCIVVLEKILSCGWFPSGRRWCPEGADRERSVPVWSQKNVF